MMKVAKDKITGVLFRVKPLRWKVLRGHGPHWFEAETIFGTIDIRYDKQYGSDTPTPWKWSCCIADYYDEHEGSAATLEQAKKLANEFYLGRLLPALSRTAAKESR